MSKYKPAVFFIVINGLAIPSKPPTLAIFVSADEIFRALSLSILIVIWGGNLFAWKFNNECSLSRERKAVGINCPMTIGYNWELLVVQENCSVRSLCCNSSFEEVSEEIKQSLGKRRTSSLSVGERKQFVSKVL